MKKQYTITLFAVLIILQLGTPFSMIVQRETILKNGERFRFKAVPVDPYDAFRGRYVALRLEKDRLPRPDNLKIETGQTVYAHIYVDRQGNAKFSRITTRPPHDIPYMTARALCWGKEVKLDLPIKRYYMQESIAPQAQRLYEKQSGQKLNNVYVLVRLKDGLAVIEGLYVGSQRIEDAIKQIPK